MPDNLNTIYDDPLHMFAWFITCAILCAPLFIGMIGAWEIEEEKEKKNKNP